jgi:hypothetical protein
MSSGAGPPSQMLSGPDLGAGFLHQLSIEGESDPRRFVYHAQDGGADAAGPPKGPLGPLGFVHPPSPCMFGGPRCWHRSFSLPHAEIPRVRAAYNRNRFVLQTMIDQVYAGTAVDVAGALRELLVRVSAPLATSGVPWYVGGSTGAWLQGARLAPNDIDLGTSRAGVDRIGELLGPYLIEPVSATDWPGPGRVHGARAFVGTFERGARVEWAVPERSGPAPPLEEFGPSPDSVRTVSVRFEAWEVRVSRPEYALVRAVARGREPAAEALVDLVRARGPDLELLEILLGRSTVPEATRAKLLAKLRG